MSPRNIMGVYTETHDEDDAYLSTNEFPMYGSARLGVQNASDTLSHITYTQSTFDSDGFYTSSYENVPLNETDTNSYHYYPLQKQYELSNHLGNVLATVSARPRLMYDNQTFTHKEPDVTSVSDYYPGGFPQPGRSFNLGSYRFGHNQQESDPEITGSWGSIYTAEYWMYDSRINWRWNPDPVIKPWQSPYSCFSGNPIWRIDPNGDDDFFNSKGEYMGSTTEGTKIRVVNDNITFENAVKSVENNTKLIAEIDYSRENMGNIKMLLNVQTHYASQVGINQNVSKIMYREGAESGEAAFYYKENFGVVIDKGTNKISSQFNDIYNTKNLWVHEKGHKDDPETGKPLGHVQLVIDQSTHETFEKTTDKFKYGMFKYTEFLLNKAIEQGTGMYGINKMIDAVNNSALGNTGFLFYDEENKRVSSAITLDPVEVGGNK